MITLFQTTDVQDMKVVKVTANSVAVADENGKVYFLSHEDFNIMFTKYGKNLIFMPVEKSLDNGNGRIHLTTFLVRMIKAPKRVTSWEK